MSGILYGTPFDERITLSDIPSAPIIEKIQRLAISRKEELSLILQYPECPGKEKLQKELKNIEKILELSNDIISDRSFV